MAKPNTPRKPAPKRTSAAKKTSAKSAKAAVGVRLDQQDRDFLEQYAPKANASEALRALVAQARTQSLKPVSVEEAQARILAALGGAADLRPEGAGRSVVVEDLVREAMLVVATTLVGPPSPGLGDPAARQAYEALIVDRSFDFLETILRHTLSEAAPAWNPGVVRARLAACRQSLVASLAASAPQHLPRSQG